MQQSVSHTLWSVRGIATLAVLVLAATTIFLAGSAQAAPPANDNFANAQLLEPDSFPSHHVGTVLDATIEEDEDVLPEGTNIAFQSTVWFKFVPAADGEYTFDTCGPGDIDDTQIAIYTGSQLDSLNVVDANDDYYGDISCPIYRSLSGGALTEGVTYYIQVGPLEGVDVQDGGFTLTIRNNEPANVPVNLTAPVVQGNLVVGQTLTCDPGTWTNEPTTFFYTWLSIERLIGYQSTVKLKPEHIGTSVTCWVWTQNDEGDSEIAMATWVGPVFNTKFAAASKVTANKKKGTAAVKLLLPSLGKVTVKGTKTYKAKVKTAVDGGVSDVTITAKGKAKKKLNKKGKVKVNVKFTFKPTGGKAKTIKKKVTLTKKK